MNEILGSYIEDLRDSIVLFNESLINVQNGVRDKDTINNIFRVAHTIKGNSAAMSFLKIQKVMHTMEDLLSEVRNGTREIDDELQKLLFACHDFLEDCLEIVGSTQTDESMDMEKLLAGLVALKENKGNAQKSAAASSTISTSPATPAVSAASSAAPAVENDIDLGFDMSSENWYTMGDYLRGGYNSYKINVFFQKNSSMKAVRAWMIFDRVDQSGIIIHSVPEKLSDSSFNQTGETPFETDIINLVIVAEKEISDLVEDLKSMADIENVSVSMLKKDDVFSKINVISHRKNLINSIRDVSIDLIGVELQQIETTTILNLADKLDLITSGSVLPADNPAIMTSRRLANGLRQSIEIKKRVPVDERESIIYLCQVIEDCLMNPEKTKNADFVNSMYKKLDELLDILLTPDKRMGDLLLSHNLINDKDVNEILAKQKEQDLKFGQIAVRDNHIKAYDMVSVLNDKPNKDEKSTAQTTVKAPATQADSGFVRVPVTKIDNLIDMLSELLIYNSQLEQSISNLKLEDTTTLNVLSRTEKLIKDIQALSMSLRMIEVKQTFHRLTRIARDTATDLTKKISVNLIGEDTEIDRSAVEKLFDPLMHMVRNSVSHGIEESEQDRINVGKKPEGQVNIVGYSKRGNIYLEVHDDGRGINTAKVFDKAKKQGLINESKEYSDQEIFKFIFLPGFSTQENVNNISGRGVGMNVVEEVVNKLGGKIEVESELGKGSIFRIKLPINLAVVNGTIVTIDNNRYIIPTMCVKKFFIAHDTDWVSMQGERRAIKVDGSIIPLISKKQIFDISDNLEKSDSDVPSEYEMVVLEIDQKSYVLHVDRILGRQDVVSKPLSTNYASVPYATSASILGDGIVSLILDIDAIFKISQHQQ